MAGTASDGATQADSGAGAGAERWCERWEDNDTPWDFGGTHPLLSDMVSSLPAGRALVPGCGSGYDVVTLATTPPDRVAVGLDVSERAIEHAAQLRDKQGVSAERAQFVSGDFFALRDSFDLIYDYTFFCALPPSWRPQWAAKMSELTKPGGTLFTLMFPVGNKEGGPPHAVSHGAYASVLEPAGFELRESGEMPERFQRKRAAAMGGERYALWIRRAQ